MTGIIEIKGSILIDSQKSNSVSLWQVATSDILGCRMDDIAFCHNISDNREKYVSFDPGVFEVDSYLPD